MNSSQTTEAGSFPSPATPVTWQTLFWVLATLSINTMAQPCGRVCGTPSKYRFYLRHSPIICFFDILSFLTQVVFYTITLNTSFKNCISVCLSRRFDDDFEPGNLSDMVQRLNPIKTTTIIRWAFFILGPMGPGIKLMAMSGVPLSKCLGAMFLVSYFFGELILILSWTMDNKRLNIKDLDHWSYSWVQKEHGRRIERVVVRAALGLHLALLSVLTIMVWWPRPPEEVMRDPREKTFGNYFMFISHAFCILFSGALGVRSYVQRNIGRQDRAEEEFGDYSIEIRRKQARRWENALRIAILLSFLASAVSMTKIPYAKWIVTSLLAIFLAPILGLLVYIGCKRLVERRSFIALNLVLVAEADSNRLGTGKPELDTTAYYSLLLTLSSLGISLAWYALRYNPDGTVNPGWTGVFG